MFVFKEKDLKDIWPNGVLLPPWWIKLAMYEIMKSYIELALQLHMWTILGNIILTWKF